ncbi:DUF3558 domain-containing protein [Nocardia nova]|nr:DUF3558 domain-containing protein [Nocardia nova]
MRTALIVSAACLSFVVLTSGCSLGTGGSISEKSISPQSVAPSRPTLTASKLQPPPQHNKYTTQGRPEVVFDPCTWISDDTIRESGFDPATRKRGDDMIAEYSFLTCDFSSDSERLMLNSGNATWDEDLQKVGAYSDPIIVNGREALRVHDPKLSDDCQVDLRTRVGFVQITVSPGTWSSDPVDCNRAMTIASNIEKEIGKDN